MVDKAKYFILVILLICCSACFAQAKNELATQDPSALLARARRVMGFDNISGRLVHYHAAAAISQNFQSERWYPPFFSAFEQQEIWFDAISAVMRVQSQTTYPGSPQSSVLVLVDDGKNAVYLFGERSIPVSRHQVTLRGVSPWAVIADWSAAGDVRVLARELYRDYPRLVLSRETSNGAQKLYLDAKSGFPVKLDYIESNYLWGQHHIEYLWSDWVMKDGIAQPGAAFRMEDGDIEISQTVGRVELVAKDASISMSAPGAPAQPPAELPIFLQPSVPKQIQIGINTWLLSNRGDTEAVTLANGEIFVFDATQSEERASQDAEAISKLFPGNHKINVVVTDLAWPHISGVRYWVSKGATIISHSAAQDFLQQVISRQWTLAPDTLEKERGNNLKSVTMNFVGVDKPTNLAGGVIRILPIDGIGSEVALVAYVESERFLWASDFIQNIKEPTEYASEVVQAVANAGIKPDKTAAEHLPLTDWVKVVVAQSVVSAPKN